MLRARARRGLSTTSGNPLVASLLEWSSRTAFNRRGLLALAAGFFFGGGGLSGAALLSWNATAATPPEEDKQERRRRKAEAKLAAHENASDATISGLVRRWRWLWWPHWELAEAEVRRGLLLLRAAAEERSTVASGGGGAFATGRRCTAVPLAGAKAAERGDAAERGGVAVRRSDSQQLLQPAREPAPAPFDLELTTSAGERETLRLRSAEERSRWARALRNEQGRWRASRRVVEVQMPATWEAPFEAARVVPLARGSAEYERVERLALAQQFRPRPGAAPYVKGKLKVTAVSRVQQPHVWEQYCMRRAILAAENDGEPTERLLWHGTPTPHLITREGFDPRVCSLSGMFGGGVYFADRSTKSVRYAGASAPGDKGTLLLCRVALGRPMLKYLPQHNMRRPPDPMPLFGVEHLQMWMSGAKFHSVFASCDSAFSPLLMNEYIVYHTNQGYPEYMVEFELR